MFWPFYKFFKVSGSRENKLKNNSLSLSKYSFCCDRTGVRRVKHINLLYDGFSINSKMAVKVSYRAWSRGLLANDGKSRLAAQDCNAGYGRVWTVLNQQIDQAFIRCRIREFHSTQVGQIGARPHAVVRKPNQQIRRPKEKFTPQLIHGSIHPRPLRVLRAGRYSQPTHPS